MIGRVALGIVLVAMLSFSGGAPVFRAQASSTRVTAPVVEGYEPCGITLRPTIPDDGAVSREVAERAVRIGRPFDYVAHGDATVGVTFSDGAGDLQPIVDRPAWVFANYTDDYVAPGPPGIDSRSRIGAAVTVIDSRTGRSIAEWSCAPPQTVPRHA